MSFFNGDILASSSDGIVLKDLGTVATTPSSGYGTIYVNGDALYFKSDGGTATDLTSGGASLTGSTNNTICTVTGSNAIQGEANLSFDGSFLYSLTATTGFGAGFNNVPSYTVYINNIGGETITNILITLGNGGSDDLYSMGSDTIIGNTTTSTNPSYIYNLVSGYNGVIYYTELICYELPVGGTTSIGLGHSTGDLNNGASSSSITSLISPSTLSKGLKSSSFSAVDNDKTKLYLYTSDSTAAAYTSGKILIKLYGVK